MDMGIGGSSGASWTFDIKKRVYVLQKELKQVPDLIFHISTGLKVGDSKYPTVK